MTRRKRSNPPGESVARRGGSEPDQTVSAEEQAAALRARAQELEQIQGLQFTWSGQFPHPQDIRVYEEYYPGFLQRLMEERSLQIAHRQSLELLVTTSNVENSRRGQWLGALVVLAAIAVCGIVAILGQPLIGMAGALSAIGLLAGVFVYGNERRVDELRAKWQRLAGSNTRDNDQPPAGNS